MKGFMWCSWADYHKLESQRDALKIKLRAMEEVVVQARRLYHGDIGHGYNLGAELMKLDALTGKDTA